MIDKIWDFQASGTQEDVLICEFLFRPRAKLNVKGYESPDEIVSRLTCQCLKNVLIQIYVLNDNCRRKPTHTISHSIELKIQFFRNFDEYRIQ